MIGLLHIPRGFRVLHSKRGSVLTEQGDLLRNTVELLEECVTVVGVQRRSGRCDAVDYILSIDNAAQAKFQRYLEYLQHGIPVKTPENLRVLKHTDDDLVVLELKAWKCRLYIVRDNGLFLATHGREKPKDSQVPKEIKKALEIYDDWKERLEEQDDGDL